MTAYSQGLMLLEVAEDQAESFIRAVADPALTFASWTSVRAVIESCALAVWLLEADITAQIRVQRSLAFRHEGLEQQLKFLKSIEKNDEVDKLVQRIDSVELEAIALGFPRVLDRRQRRIGIGQVMPSVTTIMSPNYHMLMVGWGLTGVDYSHEDPRSSVAGTNRFEA